MSGVNGLSRLHLLLLSDPEAVEAKNASAMILVGFYGFLVNSGLIARTIPLTFNTLSWLLGPWAVLLNLVICVIGFVQLGAVFRNLLPERRVCAVLSACWWLFATGQTIVVFSGDTRTILYGIACAGSIWCGWRLLRHGVR